MEPALRAWLASHGFPQLTGLVSMQTGLGATSLWSFDPGGGQPRLVARCFAPGNQAAAERERLAMTTALAAGGPVPQVVASGEIDGAPVLVTLFVEGAPIRDRLLAAPQEAGALGRAMGVALGQIHRCLSPVSASTRSWLDGLDPSLEPLRSQFAHIPDQDRLLHLDYHPLNVIDHGGAITGVIDWENTRSGPPHIDLARSRAILQATLLSGVFPPEATPVIAAFEGGLVAGHTGIVGPDPHPALSTAWGLTFTLADLTAQSAKPGTPFTAKVLARLTALRDEAIATAFAD